MLLNLVATMLLPHHMNFLYRSQPFSHFLHKSLLRMNVRKGHDISLSAYYVLFPLAHGRLQQPRLIKDREKKCYGIKQQCNKYNACERNDVLLQEGTSFVWCLRSDCTVIKAIPGFLTHLPETLQSKKERTNFIVSGLSASAQWCGEAEILGYRRLPSLNTHFCETHQKKECSEPEHIYLLNYWTENKSETQWFHLSSACPNSSACIIIIIAQMSLSLKK